MTDPNQSVRLLEALLFASAEPLGEAELAARLPDGADLPRLLERLGAIYANRGVNLVCVGRKWALRTAADLAPALRTETTVTRRLSRAAVETLAIIAYHQPITRAEIEEVRGVRLSRGTLDLLFEAGWVTPKGRRRTPGRPVNWGTTDGFLDHFGLASLDDLPGIDELKAAGLLDPLPPGVPGTPAGAEAGGEAAEAGEDQDEARTASGEIPSGPGAEAGRGELAAEGLAAPGPTEPDPPGARLEPKLAGE